MNKYENYSDAEKEKFRLAVIGQFIYFNQIRKTYFLEKAVNKIWYN